MCSFHVETRKLPRRRAIPIVGSIQASRRKELDGSRRTPSVPAERASAATP